MTITSQAPYLHLASRAVTLDQLRQDLGRASTRTPHASVSINANGKAPVQQLIKVLDVVQEVHLPARVLTHHPTGP